MVHPEKNDVNISKLFHWGSEFTIVDKYSNEIATVYIRLVGDSDINKARTYALRRSTELRRALKTSGTDEREAFISSVYEIDDKAAVIEFVKSLSTRQFARDASKEVHVPMPREPKSDASLEDQEIYQAQVDTYSARREDAIIKYVTEKLNGLEKSLEEKPIIELQRQYERLMIDELCENEMVEKFREYCVYCSVYSDPGFKERFFTEFSDFENLPTEIKNQYENYYDSLEINVDELKKLLGATQ